MNLGRYYNRMIMTSILKLLFILFRNYNLANTKIIKLEKTYFDYIVFVKIILTYNIFISCRR